MPDLYKLWTFTMRIVLRNIRLYAYHGVMPQEKTVGDWYTINLQLIVNNEKATESDNLNDTVSYADVFDIVRNEMCIRSKLLEHVCGRICRSILDKCPLVSEVSISMLKNNPPMGSECTGCGVELTVSRD